MLSIFGVATIMSYANVYFTTGRFAPLLDETVFLLAVLSMFVFQKQVLKLTNKLVSPLVPMTNNIVEFYKSLKILAVIVSSYIAFFFIFSYFKHYYIYQQVLDYVFAFALLALVIFSYLKTRFVHFHLTDDRWLPVVTDKGEVVEKMKRLSSLSDQRLYMHPVVRGILIKEGRILVQKSTGKDIFYDKPLWDNMIDNHIGIGEKDRVCLKKTALKLFGIEIKKSFCLTEYIHTTPYEHQYEFVFLILDYSGEIKPNPKKIAEIKWLSPSEIESELDSGIFDERFVKEYGLLKRAGLLMTEE